MSTTDAELIAKVQRGSRETFSLLVERYFRLVYGIAFGGTLNHAEAEDITQSVFLQAFRSLHQLRDAQRFAGWLATTTRHCVSQYHYRRVRTWEIQAQAVQPDVAPPSDAAREELFALVRVGVGKLEANHREVLTLHYFSGLSISEMAQALSITPDAAKKRLERARAALGESLFQALPGVFTPRTSPGHQKARILAAVAALPMPTPDSPIGLYQLTAALGTQKWLLVSILTGLMIVLASIPVFSDRAVPERTVIASTPQAAGEPLQTTAAQKQFASPAAATSSDTQPPAKTAHETAVVESAKSILTGYAKAQQRLRGFIVHFAETKNYADRSINLAMPRQGNSTILTEGSFGHDFVKNRSITREDIWGESTVRPMDLDKTNAEYRIFCWADGRMLQYSSKSNANAIGRSPEVVQRFLDDPMITFTSYFPGAEGMGYFNQDQRRLDTKLAGVSLVLRKEPERIGNASCYVIEGQTRYGYITAWFDPERDYALTRYIAVTRSDELIRDNITVAAAYELDGVKTYVEVSIESFAQIDGFWLPEKVIVKNYITLPKGDYHNYDRTITLDSWIVNPDFDAQETFSLNDIPDDSRWQYVGEGLRQYRWDGGQLSPIS